MIRAGKALVLSKQEIEKLFESLKALDWPHSNRLKDLKLYDFIHELSSEMMDILEWNK